MKQVIAIIRMNMMNATKQALVEAGFPAFTARKVIGRGKAMWILRVIQGAEADEPEAIARLKDDGPMLRPRRMMTLAVPDESVPKLIEAGHPRQPHRQSRRREDFRGAHCKMPSASAPASPARRR